MSRTPERALGRQAQSVMIAMVLLAAHCRSVGTERKERALATHDRIEAEVLSVEESRESLIYLRVSIRLINPGSRPTKLKKYFLTWTGGRKEVVPDDVSLSGGESRVVRVRVTGADGDLGSLLRESARVETAVE